MNRLQWAMALACAGYGAMATAAPGDLDLSFGGTVQWRPAEMPVDNFNTLTNDPFATLDLRASYQITPWAGAYVEMRNVTDETYASSTLITDQARADQAAYLPGEGRAVYGGLRVAF